MTIEIRWLEADGLMVGKSSYRKTVIDKYNSSSMQQVEMKILITETSKKAVTNQIISSLVVGNILGRDGGWYPCLLGFDSWGEHVAIP